MTARDAAELAAIFAAATAAVLAALWAVALATGGTPQELLQPSYGIAGGAALCYVWSLVTA